MKHAAVNIHQLTAKDIMNEEVVFVTSDMTVAELAEFFQGQDVTGAPVVNSKGKVIGVVSETDIVAADSLRVSDGNEAHGYFKTGWEEGEAASEAIDYEKMSFTEEKTVEEIMTPWVVSVAEDTPVEQIARKMIADRVHRILVMDSKNHLKGIVSSMDIVRLVAENAEKE